ncbi:MAG: DUF934 domain-containing protein [Mesorhizobium sp.]
MTDTLNAPETRLWTPDGFRQDDWTHADDYAAEGTNSRIILPLKAYLDMPAEERQRDRERIGVELAPGDPLDAIIEHLDGLALVALSFPVFSDGRSFSKADLLRSRHGFQGPVRATGQVLVDQLPHMLRVGFTEFEVSNKVLIERLEKGETGGIALHYQPAAKAAAETGGYSWRRTRQ